MNKVYQIKTNSLEHRNYILKCLLALGYITNSNSVTTFESANKYLQSFLWLVVYPNQKTIEANKYSKSNYITTTLDNIILLTQETISVKLNSEYTAEVSKDYIKVGCQTFPASIIDDLKTALIQLNK